MHSHQSDVFQDRFQIIFQCWLNLFVFSSFRSVSTIHGGVSRRHSRILKTEEEFLLNPYPFSQRFAVLASYYPLELFHLSDILFLTIWSMSEVLFPFLFIGGHHSSYRPIIIPMLRSSILYQFMISSFFCI